MRKMAINITYHNLYFLFLYTDESTQANHGGYIGKIAKNDLQNLLPRSEC